MTRREIEWPRWGRAGAWGVVLWGCVLLSAGCKQEYRTVQQPPAGSTGAAAVESPAPEVEVAKAGDEAVPAVEAPAVERDAVRTLTSDWHPAAREREYKLLRAAEVPSDPQEETFVTQMSRARDAEKAFRVIKKEKDARLPFLRRAVRHPNREVRIQAIVMLGLLKDASPETEEVLFDAVLLDRDPDVRASAAKDFIVLKSPKAVDVLVRSMAEDPYEAARANAAWALGSLKDKRAVDPLRAACRDEDTFVRLRAVSALLKLKPKSAIPELIERLDDKSPMVQERALEALRAITGKNLGKESDRWRKAFPN